MATRLNKFHADWVKQKIQASQLVNRLQSCAMGEIELSKEQIRCIEILLKKSIPDLAAVQVSGDEENPVTLKGVINLVRPTGS